MTTNVAGGGVQLCCPEMRYRGMQQGEKDGRLTIKLRISGIKNWINVNETSRYTNLTGDESLIGFQFNSFDGEHERLWVAYIVTLINAKPKD